MSKQTIIASMTGSQDTLSRLYEVGLFPGQTVRVLGDGILRVNEQFTVALRLTDAKIVLE